jgi:hypothetical protein
MVLKSAVGANPTLFYQLLIASRHSLPFFFRLADLPISFGSAGASPSQFVHRLKSVAIKKKKKKPAKAG